jgi:hypothetical protein
MYENQLTALEGSQFGLENMKVQSEMMRDQINVIKTMQESNQIQKNLMKEMNAETMMDIAFDMKEMQDNMNEINEVFQESYKVDLDDADLDAELDELDFENQDKNFNMENLMAPNKKVLSKKEQDEKKLEDEIFG